MYYDCDKVRERFSAGYDGKENIAVHLQTCPECAAAYGEYKAFIDELRGMPEPELPVDFHKKVMQAVRAEVRGDTRRRNKIAGWATMAAACFLAAVIWTVGILLPGQQEYGYEWDSVVGFNFDEEVMLTDEFVPFTPFSGILVEDEDLLDTYVIRRGRLYGEYEMHMGIMEMFDTVEEMEQVNLAFECEPIEYRTFPPFIGVALLLFAGAGATLMAFITLRR